MAAYMVAVCEITKLTEGMKIYSQKSAEICRKHGGKYLVRGLAAEDLEGELLKGKYVIISEFPTMADLQAFIKGEEYQAIKHHREGTGTYHISFFESPPPAMT